MESDRERKGGGVERKRETESHSGLSPVCRCS